MKRKFLGLLVLVPATLAVASCDSLRDRVEDKAQNNTSSIETNGLGTSNGGKNNSSPIEDEKVNKAVEAFLAGDYLFQYEVKQVTTENGETDTDETVTTCGKKGNIIWNISQGSKNAYVIDGDNAHCYSQDSDGNWGYLETLPKTYIEYMIQLNTMSVELVLSYPVQMGMDDAKKIGTATVAGVSCNIYEVVYGGASIYGSYGTKYTYKINSDGLCFSYHFDVSVSSIEGTASSYTEMNVLQFSTNPTAPELPAPTVNVE